MAFFSDGGGSSLTIDALSEGVSKEGIEAVLGEVKLSVIDNATTNLQDTTAIVEAVQAHWIGADADQWLTNFEALEGEIVNSLQSYYDQIEAEFQKVFDDWEAFQSTNVTQG